MSEVQHTVRDAINRLKEVNGVGKTNLSDKGVDLPADEPTTTEVVDGIEQIKQSNTVAPIAEENDYTNDNVIITVE